MTEQKTPSPLKWLESKSCVNPKLHTQRLVEAHPNGVDTGRCILYHEAAWKIRPDEMRLFQNAPRLYEFAKRSLASLVIEAELFEQSHSLPDGSFPDPEDADIYDKMLTEIRDAQALIREIDGGAA